MSYKELYAFCQDLTPAISRKTLKAKVLELSGQRGVSTRRTTLDISVCRGFFLSADNTEHPIVQQHGQHVIVLARDLNKCWERFVFVKELMHFFDSKDESTDSGDEFEKLLQDLFLGGTAVTPQSKSEVKCFWMALGALCPEEYRQRFSEDRKAGHIDDYAIALQLRIPQQYVTRLFEPRYDTIMEMLLA